MLELKNSQVLEAVEALRELAGEKMPVRTSLKVMRLAREVETAAEDIDKVRQQIIMRHVQKDEHGTPVPVLGEDGRPQEGMVTLLNPQAFQREMRELLDSSSSVEAAPLDPEELGEALEISPRTLLQLGPLLRMQEP